MVEFVKSGEMIKVSDKVDKLNTHEFSSDISFFIQGRTFFRLNI